jgi:hypothetical protein
MTKAPPLVIRCQDHPTYHGLTKPKRNCQGCEAVRFMRGASVRLHVSGTKVSDPSYDAVVRWGSA